MGPYVDGIEVIFESDNLVGRKVRPGVNGVVADLQFVVG